MATLQDGWISRDKADAYLSIQHGKVEAFIKAGDIVPSRLMGKGPPKVKMSDLDRLMIPVGVLELAKDAA